MYPSPFHTEDFLKALVRDLPARTFCGHLGPYLTRYTLQKGEEGSIYIHHFHRGDEEEELHSHPWAGESLILLGGYCEERRGPNHTTFSDFYPGKVNRLEPDTFHRVELTTKDCWTLFRAERKVADWGFWNKTSGLFTQWETFIRAKGIEPIPMIGAP